MAAANLEAALVHIFGHEGGYVDHPADPGGATNWGITIGTYSKWLGRPATKAEVKAMPKSVAAAIYRAWYAKPVAFDELPPGVDLFGLDSAINSGPNPALKWMGGAFNTQANALAVVAAARVCKDMVGAIKRACANRMSFLRSLGTFVTFGVGWTRRVAAIEATAVKWWLKSQDVPASVAQERLNKESADAAASSKKAVRDGAIATGGSAGSGGAGWWSSLDYTQKAALIAVAVLLVVGVVFFIKRAIVDRQRANAYAEAAA